MKQHLQKSYLFGQKNLFSAITLSICFFAAQVAPAGEPSGFHWVTSEETGTTDLLFDDQPVLRYMHAYDTSTKERAHETYKVYHHVFGPGTKTIITKGQGGLYTHHRGMFLGWNKTGFEGTSLDFWHCTKGAHLRHVKFLDKQGDTKQGSMIAEIHWNDAEGKPVIIENRTVSVKPIKLKSSPTVAWQIDWQTELNSQRGEITLKGDRQHAGFQYRAAQPVAEAKGARYIRPEGFPQEPEAFQVGDKDTPPKHVNLGWLAMTYQIDKNRYTVEYFSDPSLPKPARYSERPYGRFGAYFKTTLTEEKPLKMRYRVIISAGDAPSQERIQSRYDNFVDSLK